jgi:acyl-[acyl-carrier-protein]-phospholipid O-acyltransferase / long-chain-fatty-acid--[acyl-carrier-protein] ligase
VYPTKRKANGCSFCIPSPDDRLQDCLAKLDKTGLPNLWIPRPQAFFKVEALPYLGTGKMDLKKIRELAVGLSTARALS